MEKLNWKKQEQFQRSPTGIWKFGQDVSETNRQREQKQQSDQRRDVRRLSAGALLQRKHVPEKLDSFTVWPFQGETKSAGHHAREQLL